MGFYAHFHPSEHHFVDKVSDWIQQASEQHMVKVSGFLDPRQAEIAQSLVNRCDDAKLSLFGGYAAAERKRAVIAPDYRSVDEEEAAIALIAITSGDTGFSRLEHGDFLGALLGLGVKREVIGDVHVLPDYCYCLVAGEMASYIHSHLQKVHRIQVHTEILPLDRLQEAPSSLEMTYITVASLRLDGIVSDVYRLSRAKVLDPIKNGRCRINWRITNDPSALLKEGDTVSFQGFGRFTVMAIEGLTKKERVRIKVGKYV